ncbi:MAG: hypothetical protein Q9187_000579 [Circinaria calcarea]
MALGRKSQPAATNVGIYDKEVHPTGEPQVETDVHGYDTEKQASSARKVSRVGGPIMGVVGDSDSDAALSVGKQMEMESSNAIKYRTCSWKKVCANSILLTGPGAVRIWMADWAMATVASSIVPSHHLSYSFNKPLLTLDSSPDGGAAIFGVHFFGHHVIPILLFGSGTGTRSHLDCGGCWFGLVHLPDPLVSSTLLGYKWELTNRREFCLQHPEVRDVCDLGQMLFYNWKWVWYVTAIMFLLNNTFIQGLHVLVGAKYLNTMTNHSMCTIGFSAIMMVISFVCSLPRTFDTLSKLATASAFFTFISVVLAAIFAGIEAYPAGYNPDPTHINPATGTSLGGAPVVLIFPAARTKFVAGMNAFLNISYTLIGQITLPSFIAEMKNPADFPKALWAVTIAEILVFSLTGAIVYVYTGTQYNTAPAFGSLGNDLYKKVAFSFMIPTLIFLGVLYASVSARFVFFRLFDGTRHKGSHTVIGWASWAGILAGTWIVAFIIAEVIPFFSDLLSLMSSLFDSFFGFIFWGVAYFRRNEESELRSRMGQEAGSQGYLWLRG